MPGRVLFLIKSKASCFNYYIKITNTGRIQDFPTYNAALFSEKCMRIKKPLFPKNCLCRSTTKTCERNVSATLYLSHDASNAILVFTFDSDCSLIPGLGLSPKHSVSHLTPNGDQATQYTKDNVSFTFGLDLCK